VTDVTLRGAELSGDEARGAAGGAGPQRWLEPDEREAWLSLLRVMAKLPPLLDAQLERSAGLNFFEYTILAILSEQADRALRMSHLAALTNASPSRLSHAARHLEARGLLVRERDLVDGRCIRAVLTEAGWQVLVAAVPGHVDAVRDLVIDALDPGQLGVLRAANEQILWRVDPDQQTRPAWSEASGATR
jgi:DNA-binding MarR family transcriptional regulator